MVAILSVCDGDNKNDGQLLCVWAVQFNNRREAWEDHISSVYLSNGP